MEDLVVHIYEARVHFRIRVQVRARDSAIFEKGGCRKGQVHHHPKPQANLTESEVIAAVVSEVNVVNNMIEWVADTGATRHICSNKEMFLDYEEVIDRESVYLGDAHTASVAREGKGVGRREGRGEGQGGFGDIERQCLPMVYKAAVANYCGCCCYCFFL
ncbi:hypothetical protein SO802_027223 [Lithocarpus litseifolius]|uniref:Retrovirus-related Pol polyprotein from transposon TNT 1-94-like beta-barrel domain-containing protein n=1 Tax=Lithocarpus litseifolius TaxID=425828 RepID=A0AAW2C3Z7_9ROSI